MVRARAILIALTVTTACIGLWYLVWIAETAFARSLGGKPLPALTGLVISNRTGLLLIPVAVMMWCIAILPRPTSDHVALFGAASALFSTTLFFIIAVALLLPLIMIVDF
jgi:hypothetical protein